MTAYPHPHTIDDGAGSRLTFVRTEKNGRGEKLIVENHVKPGEGPPMHVHHLQSESITVVHGTLAYEVAGEEPKTAGPGETVTFEAGVAHKFWNAGDDEAHFVCEVRPALQFEELLETMFALAADGKTNRKGMPNPLRLAVIANAHFDTVRLPFPPAWMQKAGLLLGAPLGRLLGYRPTYEPRVDADPALGI